MNTTKPTRRSPRRPREADLGFTWGPINSVLLALAVVALVAGYMSLARGSTTLAPVLLVLGYVGLIPASLLIRGRKTPSGE